MARITSSIKAMALAVLFIASMPTNAQTLSPFSEFQSMSVAELGTLQIKLTYVGPQSKGIASIGIITPGAVFDLAKFFPFRRSELSYANDDSAVRIANAPAVQLKTFLDAVAGNAAITAGSVDPNPFLSLSLCNTSAGQPRVFETVLSGANAATVFNALRGALFENQAAQMTLADMACPLGLSEAGVPADITGNASFTFSGITLDRRTGRFVGIGTLKNTGAAAVTGPISVVIDLPESSAKVFNRNGTTCATAPIGRAFLNAAPVGNTLLAGASVQLRVEFTNPDLEPIRPTTKILAGPGAR